MHKKLRSVLAILLVTATLAPIAAAAATSGVVNVNTATAEQLQMLPRIGPSVAQRILEHRKENGKFASLDDLMLVRGIGEATFQGLKPYVSLSGETTLKEKVKPVRGGAAKPAQAPAGKPASGAEAKPQG
jgi:competence protein ComEA